jgi:dolichyldiphosphatase
MSLWIRLFESIIVITGASTVAYSRIYLQYHTFPQVLVGAGIGMVLGISWYVTVLVLRGTGVVDWILHLRVVEMLWFKDGDIGSLEHDLQEEWIEWRKLHDGMNHMSPPKNGKKKKGQ